MTHQQIVVRAPQWLGDAVVATVFLQRLKIKYPQAQISVACVPSVAPVFKGHRDVAHVIILPYPHGSVRKAAKLLAQGGFDTAYILPRSFRAALECWLAGIPQRIGYAGDLRRLLLSNALRYDENYLYAHRYLKLIDEEALDLTEVRPSFPATEPTAEKWKPILESMKGPILGIAPISIAPSRTWPGERFAEVASSFLLKNGGSVVLFGAAKERDAVDAIAKRITGGPVINTCGDLSLPELGWFMSRCSALLANDSGLMHVAACFQIPSVVLFGASEPKFALPPWGRFISIQHREIFCVPCLKNHCVRVGDGHLECLRSISPQEAESALSKLENRH